MPVVCKAKDLGSFVELVSNNFSKEVVKEFFEKCLKRKLVRVEQKTEEWVRERGGKQLEREELSALLGNNVFENEESLFRKKTTTDGPFRKTACVEGTTFEPIVKKYFELKYKKEIFGDNIYLTFERNHILSKTLSASPDGFIEGEGIEW